MTSNKNSSSEEWEQLLKKAPQEELYKFLVDYAQKNESFGHQIKVYFAKPEDIKNTDNTAYYRNLISSIFDNHSYKGYIGYDEGFSTISEVDELLSQASEFCKKSYHHEAFSIASAVIMESVKAFEFMDDSLGLISGTMNNAFQMIETILKENSNEQLTSSIFTWLSQEVQNPDYNDYGMEEYLETLFFKTTINTGKTSIAHQIIDSKLQELDTEENWRRKYITPKYILQKIELFNTEGKKQEAEQLINDNLQFDSIRELKVKQAFRIKNYELAKELIIDGIKIAEKENSADSIHQWKDKLLELYKLQKDKPNYAKLVRELFIEHPSDLKYLRIYKITIEPSKWKEERNKIIEEITTSKSNRKFKISINDLAEIFVEEQMTDELFQLIASTISIDIIIHYTKYLEPQYSTELINLYKAAIERLACQTGRSTYVTLRQYLKIMAKLKDGQQPAQDLKNNLLEKYKNRPAMKEEFSKL